MDIDTYKAFRKVRKQLKILNAEVAILLTMTAALVDEGSDREAAKALAIQVANKTAALQAAIPANAGNPTP